MKTQPKTNNILFTMLKNLFSCKSKTVSIYINLIVIKLVKERTKA